MRGSRDRRLLVSRPGVIYGPDDPGNIMRMINAVRKGYFAFPGSPDIYKSYGYVRGFCDSVDFLMERDDQFVVYNYVETPTQPLRELVHTIKGFLDCGAMILPIWVEGTDDVLPNNKLPIPRLWRRMVIKIGNPFMIQGRTRREATSEIRLALLGLADEVG